MENVQDIIIETLKPTDKDMDRADGLQWNRGSFYGSGAPFTCEASKMAKLIKDPYKLARRAIAVVVLWGTRDHTGWENGVEKTENAWNPFEERMLQMGFTHKQVREVQTFGSELYKLLRWKNGHPRLARDEFE